MNRSKMSLQKHLAALKKGEQNLTGYLRKGLQDHGREPGYPNSVFRTWGLSFDQIQAQEPLTAKVFLLMAMLDRQQIPETLICKVVERDIDFTASTRTPDGFSLISKGLKRYVPRTTSYNSLCVSGWSTKTEKCTMQVKPCNFWGNDFPTPERRTEICESLLPHAQQVPNYDLALEEYERPRVKLLHNLG